MDHEKFACGVGDSPYRDVQEDYREVESFLLHVFKHYLGPIAVADREARKLNFLFLFFGFVGFVAPNRKRKSNARVKRIQGGSGDGVSS